MRELYATMRQCLNCYSKNWRKTSITSGTNGSTMLPATSAAVEVRRFVRSFQLPSAIRCDWALSFALSTLIFVFWLLFLTPTDSCFVTAATVDVEPPREEEPATAASLVDWSTERAAANLRSFSRSQSRHQRSSAHNVTSSFSWLQDQHVSRGIILARLGSF